MTANKNPHTVRAARGTTSKYRPVSIIPQLFETVNSNIPIVDVCEHYGVHLDRHGTAPCPFHDERTASFKVFPNNNTWHCFGCGAGKSNIDFVMRMFNLSPLEAARKLDADFRLGLCHDRQLTPTERIRAKRETERWERERAAQERQRHIEQWLDQMYYALCRYRWKLLDWREEYKPDITEGALHPLFAKSLMQLDLVDHVIDEFIKEDTAGRVMLIKTLGREVLEFVNEARSVGAAQGA